MHQTNSRPYMLSAWKSNEIKWEKKKKDWQLKSFEKLVVLFLGPALSGLGDGVGLPDLLARPVWGRSHWAGVDHVACFALRSNRPTEWMNMKQTSKQKAKVWRAGLLRICEGACRRVWGPEIIWPHNVHVCLRRFNRSVCIGFLLGSYRVWTL